MFDDYVEHASGGGPIANRYNSQVQYEGFESTPYDDGLDEEDILAGPSSYGAPDYEPMFQVTGVQHPLPAPLVSLAVSSNILTMALRSGTLQQLSLNNDGNIANIGMAGKKNEVAAIYKIFTDPTGKHTIITTQQGDNFYLYEGWQKARPIRRQKMVIESVAWNPSTSSSASGPYPRTSSREILVGDRNGAIYEMMLDATDDMFKTSDRYVQHIYGFPERQPVTGLHVEFVPGTNRMVVLATSSSRLYQFAGASERRGDEVGKLYEPVFVPYRDVAPKFLELPGSTTSSELHVYRPSSAESGTLMAWLTAQGVYHGTLNMSPNAADSVESASLLQYPYQSQSSAGSPSSPNAGLPPVPISMAVTDFHFLLLYHDRICAVGRLDERLVYEEPLGLRPSEKPIAMAADPVDKTYWIYTPSSLLEVRVAEEDRDVWRIQLQRGRHDLALRFAKSPAQRALINGSLADQYFENGKFIQAAQCYAESTRGFEDVALKFQDIGEVDALRSFLGYRLERVPKTERSQRMMLATWLVEIYLGKLNTLDDIVASESASLDVDNLRAERAVVDDELRQFLRTYKSNLHRETVYELILSHGRTDVLLSYATLVGDFQRVIEHYVMNEEWQKAVDQLNRQSDLELYYRFSSVLMRHAPKDTVDSWLRQPSLNPHRLIPALLQHQHAPSSPLEPNHAVRYLQHVIFAAASTSPMIHNLLLTFLVAPASSTASPSSINSRLPPVSNPMSMSPSSGTASDLNTADLPLLRFLSTAPTDPLTSRPYYDLDYALRLCKRHNRLSACVHIYAQMEMWEESVELALEMGDLELARINADRPPEEEGVLRKKLWLMVAKYVVQEKKDIKTAMKFLDNTTVLKIEDILPFFPDFVIIDDFKDEICNALESYSAQIESLKGEMNDATKTADMIKQDIVDLKNRFVTVEPTDSCVHCELPLLSRQFYIFPCQHTFHADCLIGQVKEYLPSSSLRRIIHLQDELLKLTGASPPPAAKPKPAPHSRQNSTADPAPVSDALVGGQQARALLSAGARAVVAPAVASRNVFVAAGAGLRDLIIPESLATAVASNINLNLATLAVPWGTGSGEEKSSLTTQRARERAEKLKDELDELLAASCPLCESVVVGLDKPFVRPDEIDHSWDL